MKAQVSIEYYFSLVLFVMFTAYIFFRLITIHPMYSKEIRYQMLMSEAYQVSEILVNDAGEPPVWNSVFTAKRIGLAAQANAINLVSTAKINELNNSCRLVRGYNNVSAKLGIPSSYQFNITILDLTSGNLLATCYPRTNIVYRQPVSTVTRIAATDTGSYVSVIVSMW